MKKSILSLVLACLFLGAQAEEMWHVIGTNDYARKQCVEKIKVFADSTSGTDYYFQNIPWNPGEADLDSLFFMVFDRLTQTGSRMPTGYSDIGALDEGESGFYRSTWMLNEYPADGGWWIWDDGGVSDLQGCTWTENTSVITSAYMRLLYNLHLQNTYLHIADSLNVRPEQRAQVRFVRALTAWYLLDLFPSSHFRTQPGIDVNAVISRAELYAWLENELQDLVNTLPPPEKRSSLYQVDKMAANLLLARLYLNAEVYTGTAQWQKASYYAQQVMNSMYCLHTTNGTYSAYQKLFMGDNDVNGAAQEVLLMLKQDGLTTYSYGGSIYVINMSRDYGMPAYCTASPWYCWRSGYRLIQAFASSDQIASATGTEFTMPALLGDDRAMFFADGTYKTPTMTTSGSSTESFKSTWSINKFTNRYSVDPMDGSSCSGSSDQWPDTDLPLMRVAEAYLTFAEAQFRMGNAADAREIINNTIRARAHAAPLQSLSLDVLLDEWQREFYSEGRRRVDLIRFGQFASPSATRTWEGHSKITDESRNTYPMPDLLAKFPRFSNEPRYFAYLASREAEPLDPTKGVKCDSCNTGETYYDAATNTVYSVNQSNYGLGGGGLLQGRTFELTEKDTLQLELAEFPYQVPEFGQALPAVTPQSDAFTIMVHTQTDCGSDLVVLGDYLNAEGEWIYSRNKPWNHPVTGTVNSQHFTHFDPIGDGWYKAVVYPINEFDTSFVNPGYAHVTGIAVMSKVSGRPVTISDVHKVGGVVNNYMEIRGAIEFYFSQLATYEDPTYGTLYYSAMNTDRVVYLSAPEVNVPQKPDVPDVTPTPNAVTLMIKFDVAPTEGYEIRFVGDYGELATSWDLTTAKKMTPVGDGWYQIVLKPNAEGTITGRPIQVKDDDLNWAYGWTHKRGQIVSVWNVQERMIQNSGYDEYNVVFNQEDVAEASVVYLKCRAWNEVPVVPTEYTVTVTLPAFCEAFDAEIVGTFNEWGSGTAIPLQQVEGNTYRASFYAKPGAEWTIREVGNWENQIEYVYQTKFIPPMTFVKEWTTIAHQILTEELQIVLDYSDAGNYRWSKCAE